MVDGVNTFVSHLHEDDAKIGDFKDLMADRGIAIRDSSINSDRPNEAKDPEYIKHKILAPRIDWAGTVVVLISVDTKDSEFVKWEIDYAKKCGKRIVGVYTHGSSGVDEPEGLEDYADAIVAWNGDAIFDAIVGNDKFEDPTGAPRARRDISRANC